MEENKIINNIISKKGLKKIKFIEIKDNEKLKSKLEIEYVPTIILMKEGKEIKRIVGLQDEKILKEELNRYLENHITVLKRYDTIEKAMNVERTLISINLWKEYHLGRVCLNSRDREVEVIDGKYILNY